MAWPLIVMGVLSAASSVMGGASKKKAAEEEAGFLREEGSILYGEALRDASLVRKEGEIFAQNQSMEYIASGVVLGGSALVTLRETRRKAKEEADAIEKRGESHLTLATGRADQLDDQGRSNMIQGIIGGVSSIFSTFGGGSK